MAKPMAVDTETQLSASITEDARNSELSDHNAGESRLVKKLDRRLIPILSILYLLSYLDRSNIGNAKIAGMSQDLHLSLDGNDYAWLLTIFYIGYIVCEWFTIMWKIVPPNIWVAAMVACWGLVATLQCATTSWSGMMACRFLLGIFESGYGPGVVYYLSFFYLRSELGLRIGLFLSAGPLATCFAGALAYGITSGYPAIANWRLLFLVEGLPCLPMAVVAFFFLPVSAAKAKFLEDGEKAIATARSLRQLGPKASQEQSAGHLVWRDIGAALMDPKNYLTALMYFSCNVSFSSLPVFLPTVIAQMGFSAINAQGLSAPPYFLAFLVVIMSTFLADRYGQRGVTVIMLSLVGAAGYFILASTTSTASRYFGVYLAAVGIYPAIINIIPWVLNNQGSDTKRGAGIAIMNLIGQCGPLLGTRIYPATDSPYYRLGMWTCAGFMVFNAVLALVLRTYLARENKRLDREFGEISGKKEGTAAISDYENGGDRFRYVL